jgi:hypothetical protein
MVLNVSVATILKDMAEQTKENAKHLVEETKNKNAVEHGGYLSIKFHQKVGILRYYASTTILGDMSSETTKCYLFAMLFSLGIEKSC